MSLLVLAVSLVSCTFGGYARVRLTDAHVSYVTPYVNRAIPLLFPESTSAPIIQRAEIQVVAGYNLRLEILVARSLLASVVLYVNPQQVITVASIAPVNSTLFVGGWRWRDVDQDLVNGVIADIRPSGFTGTVSKVLALRTQVVAGLNIHLIFTDQEGGLHSALVYQNPQQVREVTFYRTIE
jgi:hypothetical protein